jgi:hypothetical protein
VFILALVFVVLFEYCETMEQHIFKIATKCRGRHKKGITILNAAEVSLQQNLVPEYQNVDLKTAEKMKTIKKGSKITLFWAFNVFCLPL